MRKDATKEQIDHVVERVQELGLTAIPLPGEERTAIGTFGVAALRGVADGVVVGSALVDAIASANEPVVALGALIASLRQACA